MFVGCFEDHQEFESQNAFCFADSGTCLNFSLKFHHHFFSTKVVSSPVEFHDILGLVHISELGGWVGGTAYGKGLLKLDKKMINKFHVLQFPG